MLKKFNIRGDATDLLQRHAPLNATIDRILLIQGEILACLGPQENDNFIQGISCFFFQ